MSYSPRAHHTLHHVRQRDVEPTNNIGQVAIAVVGFAIYTTLILIAFLSIVRM